MLSGTSIEKWAILDRHSLFVRTIIDWNHLEDDIVDAPSSEALKQFLGGLSSGTTARSTGVDVQQVVRKKTS